jgi:hypothetical protein
MKKNTKQCPTKDARQNDEADRDRTHTHPPAFGQTRSLFAYCRIALPDFFKVSYWTKVQYTAPLILCWLYP